MLFKILYRKKTFNFIWERKTVKSLSQLCSADGINNFLSLELISVIGYLEGQRLAKY